MPVVDWASMYCTMTWKAALSASSVGSRCWPISRSRAEMPVAVEAPAGEPKSRLRAVELPAPPVAGVADGRRMVGSEAAVEMDSRERRRSARTMGSAILL